MWDKIMITHAKFYKTRLIHSDTMQRYPLNRQISRHKSVSYTHLDVYKRQHKTLVSTVTYITGTDANSTTLSESEVKLPTL